MNANVKTSLIGRLERVYGTARNAEGLAAELGRYVPMHATDESLGGLAETIIANRKAKGFPSASELIAAVRGMPRQSQTGDRAEGQTRYEGERPVVWVRSGDDRWEELSRLWARQHPANKRPFPMESKHADGIGWFFPAHMVDAIPPGSFRKQGGV